MSVAADPESMPAAAEPQPTPRALSPYTVRVLHASYACPPSGDCCVLPLDAVANVLDRFANLATRLAESFLDFSRGLVRSAFLSKPLVLGRSADRILDSAFYLIGLSPQLIVVQHLRRTSKLSRSTLAESG